MWDSNSPLQLLNSMPEKLEEEHLNKLQLLFEADKYKNQLISGVDLCGSYAPFCAGCNKDVKYPCAAAYVNAMKAEGMNIEMVSDADSAALNSVNLRNDEQVISEENGTGDYGVEINGDNAEAENGGVDSDKQKTRIRIAIARKKII